jgi:hypothetical protein
MDKKSYQEEADEFYLKQEELLKDLPEEFHKPLAWMAYDRSHAYGFNEILLTLSDLIFNLKGPIKEFEKRILSEKGIS